MIGKKFYGARHVESLLPDGALQAAKVAEQSEQEGLRLIANRLEVRP